MGHPVRVLLGVACIVLVLIASLTTMHADTPLSEAQEYPRVLTSLTSGRGSYTLEPSRYDVTPRDIHAEIVAAFGGT